MNWLKAPAAGPHVGVDRSNNVIRGYVVAQAGPFKSQGRGEFDHKALKLIWRQMRDNESGGRTGTKSRLGHPTLSADGLGAYLGRARNPQMSEAGGVEAVRADLHLDPTSFSSPTHGNIGKYVMDLAESDPSALSSSLVLQVDEEWRLDSKGRKVRDDLGNELPPLWRPTRIHASDVVDTGDAVDDFLCASLSIDGLPDAIVRQAYPLAKQALAGKSRSEIIRMLTGWAHRVADMIGTDDDYEIRQRIKRKYELE